MLFELGLDGHYYNVHIPRMDVLAAPPETLLGKTLTEILPPDAAAICLEALHEANANKISMGRQFDLNIGNERKWFEISVAPKAGMQVDGQRFVVLSRDITERKKVEEALEQSISMVTATLNATTDGILTVDQHHHITCFNHQFLELWKVPATFMEAGGDSCLLAYVSAQLVEPEIFLKKVQELYSHPSMESFDLLNLKDGRVFERYSQPQLIRESIVGRVWSFRDVTQNKLAEEELTLAASVFTHAREGIFIADAAGIIIKVNDTFTHITGYEREEAVGQNPRILKSGRQGPAFYAAMWNALAENGHWAGEVWNRRKSGEVYAELLTISAIHDAEGKVQNYVALFTDIMPLKEHQQQLERIAHYDVLTNLPNRVLLADRLEQAISQSLRRKQSVAVVFLDLDGFKAINDQYGHDVGDNLLIALSHSIKDALREGDTLARIGGDEFVAILVDLEHPKDCEPVLERLLQSASNAMMVGNTEMRVSASIGVTLYPQDGADADQLIRHADQAMYTAKQSGKNRYQLFDVAQEDAIQVHRESLEGIRNALHQREFVLYYQPKVNMKTGVVIGVEALIRWQHPVRGLLLPADFLPVIENHQISVDVGEWVIDTALSQIAEWQAAGLDMPISVNVSARQLQQDNFVTRLSEVLTTYPEVNPAFLELEILETSALEDMNHTSEVMRACHNIGVHFALDDFGTGYSSLTYLKRLPADILKIDQSFVRDMLDDPDDLAIVDGVVGLASAFRRQVIAEGVETIAHGELLLPLGCELAQGYGIACPMPAMNIPNWVKTWRPDPAWTAWRDRRSNSDDLALVFSEVEHRHWLISIKASLEGAESALMHDVHVCYLGKWLEDDGEVHFGNHPEFLVVMSLHENFHLLGPDIIKLHTEGEQAQALVLLDELNKLHIEMIGALRRLIRSNEAEEYV